MYDVGGGCMFRFFPCSYGSVQTIGCSEDIDTIITASGEEDLKVDGSNKQYFTRSTGTAPPFSKKTVNLIPIL